jgi:hypothetical protein
MLFKQGEPLEKLYIAQEKVLGTIFDVLEDRVSVKVQIILANNLCHPNLMNFPLWQLTVVLKLRLLLIKLMKL